MKYKPFIYTLLIFLLFVGLVFYNYFKAQEAIRQTRPAPLSINLISYPKSVKAGSQGIFTWHVEASPDLSTTFTTVYWGYESSPSALTKNDSPEAVNYSHFQPDYANGSFKLPDDFDVNIPFTRPGRVWFRAFAKVKEDNLWSDEKYLDITN